MEAIKLSSLADGEIGDDLFRGENEAFNAEHELDEVLVPGEAKLSEQPAYLRQIRELPLLTPKEEIELAKKIQAGDERAYSTFFESNLRLVFFIARKVKRDAGPTHLDLDDLFMEGNFGLMKAIEDFDPNRGFKFSTYVYPRIWGAMHRALANGERTIRIPVNKLEKFHAAGRKEYELQKKFGRQPTQEELAESVGLTTAKLAKVQTFAKPLVSLHAAGGSEDGLMVADRLKDNQAIDPEEELFLADGLDEAGIVRQALSNVLNAYNEDERYIFEQHLGLGDGECKTFREIGAQLNYNYHRVRKIYHRMREKVILATKIELIEQGFDEKVEEPSLQETLSLA